MEYTELKQRIGKVAVTQYALETMPELVHKMQSRMLIIECKRDASTKVLIYTGLCEEFDVVKGGEVPYYLGMFTDQIPDSGERKPKAVFIGFKKECLD